jgi:UTP-glucose-1-phosphate uridylyltransferase
MTDNDFCLPRKAVLALGFDEAAGAPGGKAALPLQALGEHLPLADREIARLLVEEALAAGLTELIFITAEGYAAAGSAILSTATRPPREIIVPRHGTGATLEQALCSIRELIGGEAFVVIAPRNPVVARRGAVQRLLEAYRAEGGNLATVADVMTLRQKGTFAAIEQAAAGHYLLQAEILESLAENPQQGLAAALLAQAEAWPVTALPLEVSAQPAAPAVGQGANAEAAE